MNQITGDQSPQTILKGIITSPSSVCNQPKKSLGLILQAALAEQDSSEVASGREFMFSEDFCRLDKSGGSVVFSPDHSSGKNLILID